MNRLEIPTQFRMVSGALWGLFVWGLSLLILPIQHSHAEEQPMKAKKIESLATFAGGCFWCMEPPFEALKGVSSVVSGYMGGAKEDAVYKKVSSGATDHLEVVQVSYDASIITYEQLLEVFWRQINPTDAGGQFVDRGAQYQSRIFYHDDKQKELAARSKNILGSSKIFSSPIVTKIVKAGPFYPAEDYHQDYYKENSWRYKYYRSRSGRDDFLDGVWKNRDSYRIFSSGAESLLSRDSKSFWENFQKPTKEKLKETLSPLAYKVTQEDATEAAFDNEFWNHKESGIYVDVVSGEPLFSSLDKFKSGTGWPSFTKPLRDELLVKKKDYKLIFPRTEVRSRFADSHLGHVFDDGPQPTGLRYCINSSALRFVPVGKLKEEGYGEFLPLFDKK